MKTSDAVLQAIEDVLATRLQAGTVVSTAAGNQVKVTVDGTEITIPRAESYTSPAAGHKVMVATMVSGSKIVICKVA